LPFTFGICAIVLAYVWMLAPRGVHVAFPVAGVAGLALWSALRTREWGLRREAFGSALRLAAMFTAPVVLIVIAAGAAAGTLHTRTDFLEELGGLIVWGAAQQWILQTVVLREAQRASSPRAGVLLAALLFGMVHLPNPLLSFVTFGGALAWCAIYDRRPNVIPLALSHAIGTLALLYAFDDRITGRLRIGWAYLMLDE
jgi:membrane protease YdiL (CAAX protease family)